MLRINLTKLLITCIAIVLLALLFTFLRTPSNVKRVRQFESVSKGKISAIKTEIAATSQPDTKFKGTPKPVKPTALAFDWNHEEALLPGLVPPQAHLIWCGQKWVEYKHYLTVKSISRILKPDRVVMHYSKEPGIDKLRYHQWLQWIKTDEIFFTMQKFTPDQERVCNERVPIDERIGIIMNMLKEEGGIYVGQDTWLVNFEPKTRLNDFIFALEEDSLEGMIMLRGNILKEASEWKELLHNRELKTKTLKCATVQHIYNGDDTPMCLTVRGGSLDSLMPMDIWELDNRFGSLCRTLFYGTAEIRKPKPDYNELVPNIGHMIWIGGGPMDFVFFLSALSVLYVVNVDVLYIHGDIEPVGENWQKIRSNPRVKFITRLPPRTVYGGEIQNYYRALMSDIIRVDLMIKYGGIYTDTDAIWVRGPTYEDRGYEAVASFDWIDWSWPYRDSVNFGLSYGKKGGKFWHIFRDSMHELHNHLHGFTGVMEPYKLLEKYPELLRIDRRLQVICYHSRCHPIYVKDYHNETNDHVNSGTIKDWRNDVYAFHWTHPNPSEYKNLDVLLKSKGMFAEIGKYVLKKAGLLD
ncbi:unnamed protein product [Dimorphilus gyrociliatus]|uniref:Uncharacterized protein n=1 Tax=Dimorphilus gyrociliatus TaxID=2664684 RepID=A0A7I8VPN4_9ANNE|nr:unnamed protein product [Dimorphilus gyrociliatus]